MDTITGWQRHCTNARELIVTRTEVQQWKSGYFVMDPNWNTALYAMPSLT